MTNSSYSVLIRTFNSQGTLPYTLGCLSNQTSLPDKYVFVDSGSTDNTLGILPENSVVHRFAGREFNYSDAINQGLPFISSKYVFIVSSHTIIIDRGAVAYALKVLDADERLGAAYFSNEVSGGPLSHQIIDKDNFDGQNGLWNWCSLVRMDLLRKRAFLPEVFAAEDQEWASWLFTEQGGAIARIANAGAINHNPKGGSLRKLRNDYVGVAYFAKKDRLDWPNILGIFGNAFSPTGGTRVRHRWSQVILAGRLVQCRFSRPRAKSRYF